MAGPAALRSLFLPSLTLAALLAGVGLVIHGLAPLHFLSALPWSPDGLVRLPALLAGLAIAIVAIGRLLRLDAAGATLVTSVSLLVLLGAVLPLLVVATLGFASMLVGSRLRRLWSDRAAPGEDPLVDVLVGAGAYGTAISLIAHLPLSHSVSYVFMLALPIALDRQSALAALRKLATTLAAERRSPMIAYVAGTLVAMYAIVALMPEVGWDALAMHLFIPSHIAIHRSWHFDVTRFSVAVMPALVDWIYSITYVLDGERATRLVNAAFVALAAGVVFRIAALAGATRAWSWFSATLFLATPVVFTIGSSLFIDAAWTAFVLGGVLMLMRPPVPGHPPRGWVSAAAIIGFAAAAKAVTLPMLPALALLVVVEHRALRAPGAWRVIAIALAVFALAGCKPYLTAWLLTGNPVYPFFLDLFGGPAFDAWQSAPEHFKARLAWTTPYDVVFESARFIEGREGAAGFQWLLLLPATVVTLMLMRHRRGLVLVLLGTAIVALVFHFTAYLRYVVPAFALLMAAMAVAGSALGVTAPWTARGLAIAGTAVIALNLAFLNAAGLYPGFPIDTVASAARRRAFLEHEVPARSAADHAWRLPATGRLAFFGPATFAAAPGADVVHTSWYTERFWVAVREVTTPQALARVLLDWNVRYLIVASGAGSAQLRALVDQVTSANRPLVEFRNVSVRELNPEYLFGHEHLRNADLAAQEGWSLLGDARYDATGRVLRVTVKSPAFQLIPVRPGAVFRNAVRARCEIGGEARVQVNWYDRSHALLGFSLQPFACQPAWTMREQDVVAPPRAVTAVVYATSASALPVEIGAVSFRGVALD